VRDHRRARARGAHHGELPREGPHELPGDASGRIAVARVEGGLAAARLIPRKDDVVAGGAQQRLGVGDRVRKQQVAEAGGKELHAHTLILTARAKLQAALDPTTARNAREGSLAEGQARPSQLGAKGEQKRQQRHDEDSDLHDKEEGLHDHCSCRTSPRFVFFPAGLSAARARVAPREFAPWTP
jgi:hypothetical protein